MRHQELNGITDWFNDGVDYVSDKVSDAALWVTDSTGTTQAALQASESLDEQLAQIDAGARKQLKDFQNGVKKLIATQKQVDEAIESMPLGDARTRLEAKRNESRGIYENYIAPAWLKFSDWAGLNSQADFNAAVGGLGFVITGGVVIGLAAVLAATTVAMSWISSAQIIEEQILNDPELKKTYVATRGTLFSLGGTGKYIAIGAAGIGIIYLLNSLNVLPKRN